MTNIPTDTITKLLTLIGLDTNVAKKLFAQYGIKPPRKGRDGFTENLIALLLNKSRPTNKKGADFTGLFEVKQIAMTKTKLKQEYRTGGDTPLANLEEGEFFESNLWDKTKKILCVCTDEDVIVDIRLFDGDRYKETMKRDWDLLQAGMRTQTEMFSLKVKWNNQVQMKKNGCLFLSESLTEGVNNNITDQELYCATLFEENLARREDEFKVAVRDNTLYFEKFLNRNTITIKDLMKFRDLLDDKIEDVIGFKNIKDELNF